MRRTFTTIAFGAALVVTSLVTVPLKAATPITAQNDDRREDQRERHPEYYRNRYYGVGNREGYQDYQRHTQRKRHSHRYRADDDRRAHDYGYQEGWRGKLHDRDRD